MANEFVIKNGLIIQGLTSSTSSVFLNYDSSTGEVHTITGGADGSSGTSGTSGINGTPGTISAQWNFSTGSVPSSGQMTTNTGILYSGSFNTGISFNDVDKNSINRDVVLNSMGPGTVIEITTT